MLIFYPIVLRIYSFIISLCALFNDKAKDFIEGRKEQETDIDKWAAKNKSSQKIWIHSASLGEYEMSKPMIAILRSSFPNVKFILSFYSPSGYNYASYEKEDLKIYLPIDFYNRQNKLIEKL